MTISLSSPVTGGAQTGFTSPTYTVTADLAPDSNSRTYTVTALGGTQANVDTSQTSKPFTITMTKPKTFQVLSPVNPVTGELQTVPRNVWKIVLRKGAVPLSGQAASVAMCKLYIEVPAGTDSYEPEELRAMLSLFIGSLSQISAGLGDTLVSGVM